MMFILTYSVSLYIRNRWLKYANFSLLFSVAVHADVQIFRYL